jgi:hypothetical protein
MQTEDLPQPISREDWLNGAVDEFRPMFKQAGGELPTKIRVGIGFPGGRGRLDRVIGQCYPPEAVHDGVYTVFISPVHKDPVDTLATLGHELVHAAGAHGHRSDFSTLARGIGLIAPWTSTKPSEALSEALRGMSERLGPFDHGSIDQTKRLGKQTTRLIKLQCPVDGYTVRSTRKWIDLGLPDCPLHGDLDRQFLEES